MAGGKEELSAAGSDFRDFELKQPTEAELMSQPPEEHFLRGLPVPADCVDTNRAFSGTKATADPEPGQERQETVQKKHRKKKQKTEESGPGGQGLLVRPH